MGSRLQECLIQDLSVRELSCSPGAGVRDRVIPLSTPRDIGQLICKLAHVALHSLHCNSSEGMSAEDILSINSRLEPKIMASLHC
jgi:hypothetical protein